MDEYDLIRSIGIFLGAWLFMGFVGGLGEWLDARDRRTHDD